MSLYLGFGLHQRIERIRRASEKLESARAAAREAETSSSKEILDNARALLRAHRLNFGGDHLEIVDVIGRLVAALEKAQTPAPQELPASKPPARASAPIRGAQRRA